MKKQRVSSSEEHGSWFLAAILTKLNFFRWFFSLSLVVVCSWEANVLAVLFIKWQVCCLSPDSELKMNAYDMKTCDKIAVVCFNGSCQSYLNTHDIEYYI